MRVGPEGRLKLQGRAPHSSDERTDGRARKNSDGLAPPRSSLSERHTANAAAATQIVSQSVRVGMSDGGGERP